MSKIKNGGLDQYGAEPSEQQQFGTAGVEGLNTYLPKNKTSRDLDHAHLGQFVITEPVEKPPYPAIGKQGASHLYLGGLQLSSAGTGYRPLNLPLSCENVEKGGLGVPDL